jgi:hypothetical protein
MRIAVTKFVKHKDYKFPHFEWLYNCSWAKNMKVLGVQFVTNKRIYVVIWREDKPDYLPIWRDK